MTHRQELFVQEYLVSLNATQAAINAGYSPKTAASIGQENLTKPEIKQAIDTAMKKRYERMGLTQDYVIEHLIDIVERAMQKKPVFIKGEQVTDEQGRNVWTFDAKNAIKALELLGKHLSMFKPNQREIKNAVISWA